MQSPAAAAHAGMSDRVWWCGGVAGWLQIYQRQLAKQDLSAAIVDEAANQSRTFSQDELRALFKARAGAGKKGLFGPAWGGAAACMEEECEKAQAASVAAAPCRLSAPMLLPLLPIRLRACAHAPAPPWRVRLHACHPAPQVDNISTCDTHAAIKCRCDGATATAKAKGDAIRQAREEAAAAAREAAAAAAAAAAEAGGGGGGGGAEGGGHGGGADAPLADEGVMHWAHLASVDDSPDPIWAAVSSWIKVGRVGARGPGEGGGAGRPAGGGRCRWWGVAGARPCHLLHMLLSIAAGVWLSDLRVSCPAPPSLHTHTHTHAYVHCRAGTHLPVPLHVRPTPTPTLSAPPRRTSL